MPVEQKIRIQVLGFFAITVDDTPVEHLVARSRRGIDLLVRLILQQGRPISNQQLIGDLWGTDLARSHESALKTRVCRLRDLLESVAPGLEECVQAEHRAYRYQPLPNVTVDVLDMLGILQKMQGELTTEERLDCCRRIMDLYQGEPYLPVGTVGDVIHASYLRKSYLQTAHAYADLLRERGDDGALIAACRQALRQDPLEEHLRAELMRALARQGRPDEAAQEYAQAVRFARQMLDSEPGEELQACRREIAGRAK